VLIVADAGKDAGLGHIARCSAIAAGLQVRGIALRCVAVGGSEAPQSIVNWESVRTPEDIPVIGPALVVVDSYRLEHRVVLDHAGGRALAVFHDLGPIPEHADLVITTDPGVPATPELIGGLRFACLGPSYWGLPDSLPALDRVRHVLVTTGGGDPGGHAVAVASAVRDAIPSAQITLVRGPHADFDKVAGVRILDRPRSLLEPLLTADIVVSSAGNTLLEAMASGTPTVALVMADNQRPSAAALAAAGATVLCEPHDPEAVGLVARRLANDPDSRRRFSRLGRDLVDGYGALRVAFLLDRIARRQ
jgi:spore coat polysaccharide biosynthesis predicted glycosyltransferase SpsG